MITMKDVQRKFDDLMCVVFWQDTYGPKSTWSVLGDVDRRDENDYAAECITIGFKVRETEHAYYIAPTVANWDKAEKAVCGLTVIPKAVVTHVKVLDQVIDRPDNLDWDEDRRNQVVEWAEKIITDVKKVRDKMPDAAVMQGQAQAGISSVHDPKREWSENIEMDKEIQDAQDKDVSDIEQMMKDMKMEASLSGGGK